MWCPTNAGFPSLVVVGSSYFTFSGMSTPSDGMANGQLDLSTRGLSVASGNDDLDDDSDDDKDDDGRGTIFRIYFYFSPYFQNIFVFSPYFRTFPLFFVFSPCFCVSPSFHTFPLFSSYFRIFLLFLLS